MVGSSTDHGATADTVSIRALRTDAVHQIHVQAATGISHQANEKKSRMRRESVKGGDLFSVVPRVT